MNRQISSPALQYALPVLVAACLIPWFLIQLHQSMNTDLAWLTVAAQRMLGGVKMSDGYFDPNLPVSIIVQTIPALFSKLSGLPLYYSVFCFSLVLVLLSTWGVWLIARASGQFKPPEIQILMTSYILANTVLVGQYFGERDHYVILALFPFVLVQASLTWNFPLPQRAKWLVLILGSIAIQLKPPFGLIPTILLLHRAIRQRRWTVVKDADFLSLAVVTTAHTLIFVLFFSDYLTLILPDTLSLYVINRAPWIMQVTLPLLAFLGLLVLAATLIPGGRGYLPACLLSLSALCVIPFAVQGKGYFYHAIPTLVFFFCGFALMIWQLLDNAATRFNIKAKPFLPLCMIVLLIGLSYVAFPPNRLYPTHDSFRKLPLSQLVENCGTTCPFFLFNDMIEIIHPLDIYTGQTHASRFASYWFLPALVKADFALQHGQHSSLTAQDVAEKKKKYAAMVGEDFKTYNPRLVIIGQFHIVSDGLKPFDFVAYFSSDPEFARMWKHYKFSKSVTIDRSAYFDGTVQGWKKDNIEFKIYKNTDWTPVK